MEPNRPSLSRPRALFFSPKVTRFEIQIFPPRTCSCGCTHLTAFYCATLLCQCKRVHQLGQFISVYPAVPTAGRLHYHLTQCSMGIRLQVLVPILACSPRTGAPGGDLFSVDKQRYIRFQSLLDNESHNLQFDTGDA